jgi:multidrug resistance efflux pump
MEGPLVKTYRAGRLRVHIFSFLVWLAALACVVVLFRHRTARFEVVGLAQGKVYQVAANCDGRLEQIHVQLFDKIGQGQELVTIDTVLDNENLQVQLDTTQAETLHLGAQLAATRARLLADAANLQTDKVVALRRFTLDMENSKLRVLELKTQLETDRMVLWQQAVEVKIARKLVQQDAVAAYDVEKAQALHIATEKTIEQTEHLLQQALLDYIKAANRLDDFTKIQPQHAPVDLELEIIQKAIAVQEKLIDEILARKTPLVLKSPLEGVVSIIARGPGEAVTAGESILTVVEAKPTEIVAYASEDQLDRIRERMAVELVRPGERTKIARSQIVHLGPQMELMPERLWQNPNIPQWGRPMLIKVPPGMDLVCGQVVGIRML